MVRSQVIVAALAGAAWTAVGIAAAEEVTRPAPSRTGVPPGSAFLGSPTAPLPPGIVLVRRPSESRRERCQRKCDVILIDCHGRADKIGGRRGERVGDKCNENHRECSAACDRRYVD